MTDWRKCSRPLHFLRLIETGILAGMADIYIADDDPLLVDLLVFRLQRNGHCVRHNNDGEDALAEMLAQAPDMLLIDYQIPARSVHEIIDVLKRNSATSNMPILVLASLWREQEVMDALHQGITDYVIKPFAPDELLFRIERALKH